MYSEIHYRKITRDFINNSDTEKEVLQKLDLIKKVFCSESEVYNQLSQLEPRLRLMVSKNQNGILDYESFDIQMNKIISAINQILRTIKLKDIIIDFEFDERGDLFYHITNSEKEIIYKFKGNLVEYRPHGKGIAEYPNGDIFDGNFIYGNRDGTGTLYNEENAIINKGNWSKNEFIDRSSFKFFSNIKAAANSIVNSESIQGVEYELMKIPFFKEENMFGFPIDGDSMEPNLFKNDIVVCKEVFNPWGIHNGKIYIVYHQNKLVVKRVKEVKTKENTPKKYILISDNYMKHDPYEITPNEETKFYSLIFHMKPFF